MYIYIYIHRTCLLGPIRQAGGMIWVGRAPIRQALAHSMQAEYKPPYMYIYTYIHIYTHIYIYICYINTYHI